MDTADWFMLTLASIYFLFNIKNVYYFFVNSFYHSGTMFSLWLILFTVIGIMTLIFAFFAPQYGRIAQWTFIWSIVGFLVYRNTVGFKDD